MPFSFNPGQEQGGGATAPATNNGIPALIVPSIPSIVEGGNAEQKISPFAFRNRNKSNAPVYFQLAFFAMFGIMSIASIGLFAYQQILIGQIDSKKTELTEIQKGFKKPPIDEMQRLSSRLSLINKIVNERASVNTAFTILEESVNDPVTYNKFSLSKSKKNNGYDLSFGGDTTSYAALYQQVDVLKSKTFADVFKKISITGIGPLDKKGMASFKVEASVAIAGVDPDGFSVIRKSNESATGTATVSSNIPVEVVNQNNVASSTQNITQ